MVLLDGKSTSAAYKEKIAEEIREYLSNGYRKPHLLAILVGNDGASLTYVNSKEKNSKETGFDSTVHRLNDTVTETELIALVEKYNRDENIDGIIVQSPLPAHINESRITETISPLKDVDGFHDINMGRLAKGLDGFVSATPLGIMMLLESYQIETSGKHTVIVGRSNIVGRPMSLLLSGNSRFGNSTVTLCHSRTNDLASYTRSADILIAALGKPGFVKEDMVKPGAVVIDVGITRIDDPARKSGFYLRGDVDFDAVSSKAAYITPVPGGVGLMTIAALLSNTMKAYRQNLALRGK